MSAAATACYMYFGICNYISQASWMTNILYYFNHVFTSIFWGHVFHLYEVSVWHSYLAHKANDEVMQDATRLE